MRDNYLTLRPYDMKLCRLTYKTYLIEVRQTKKSLNRSLSHITSYPSYRRTYDHTHNKNDFNTTIFLRHDVS